MAQNEAASREVNEDVEGMHWVDPPGRRIQIVCECSLDGCGRVISITMAEYRQVRGDPRQFAIVPEHVHRGHRADRQRQRPIRRGGQTAGDPGRRRDRGEPPALVSNTAGPASPGLQPPDSATEQLREREGSRMCMSCGCGEPHATHGDQRNIVYADLKKAADVSKISVKEAVQNIKKTLLTKNPRSPASR